MSIIATAIAETPTNLVTLESDHSLYKCHDGSGLVLTDSSPSAKQLFGDITLSSATGSWTVANPPGDGYYAPDGTQTQRNFSSAVEANYRLDTLDGVGQMFMAVDIFADAAPTGQELIFAFGKTATGEGRYALSIISSGTAGRTSFSMHTPVDGSALLTINSLVNLYDGARHSIFAVIDCVNYSASLYVDGVFVNSATFTAADLPTIPSGGSDRGFQPFCNAISASAYNSSIGSASTGTRVSRLLFVRTASDKSSQAATLASDFHNTTHELPWSFDGL